MLFRQRSKSALREGAARKESFEFSLPLLARSPRFALFSSSSCGGPVATHKGNSIPLLISPPPFKGEASAASAAAVVCLLWRLFPPRVRGWRKTAVFVYWGGAKKRKKWEFAVCATTRHSVVCLLCVCPPALPPFRAFVCLVGGEEDWLRETEGEEEEEEVVFVCRDCFCGERASPPLRPRECGGESSYIPFFPPSSHNGEG